MIMCLSCPVLSCSALLSAALPVPLDVQLVFGLPHSTPTQQLFSTQERTLSKQMMTYMANFIKAGYEYVIMLPYLRPL